MMNEPVEFAPLSPTGPTANAPGAPLHRLQDVPVELTVEIGRTHMTIAETLKLGPGSIVSLNRLAGEPVDLLVNGKLIARGEVVVIDEEFGLRLTDVVSSADRPSEIEAVGPTPLATPTVDRGLLDEDDIAAYLGDGATPMAAAPAGLGAPAGVGAPTDVGAPVGDEDVAAYLGGFAGGGGGDPFAVGDEPGDPFASATEPGDPFTGAGADAGLGEVAGTTDDPFAMPADAPDAPAVASGADPFAGVPDEQLVSPHDDGGDLAVGSSTEDDDVAAYLGGLASEPAGESSGWVIEGDDEDPPAGGLEPGPAAG